MGIFFISKVESPWCVNYSVNLVCQLDLYLRVIPKKLVHFPPERIALYNVSIHTPVCSRYTCVFVHIYIYYYLYIQCSVVLSTSYRFTEQVFRTTICTRKVRLLSAISYFSRINREQRPSDGHKSRAVPVELCPYSVACYTPITLPVDKRERH